MVDQIYMKQEITAQVKGKCNYVLKMLPPPTYLSVPSGPHGCRPSVEV